MNIKKYDVIEGNYMGCGFISEVLSVSSDASGHRLERNSVRVTLSVLSFDGDRYCAGDEILLDATRTERGICVEDSRYTALLLNEVALA